MGLKNSTQKRFNENWFFFVTDHKIIPQYRFNDRNRHSNDINPNIEYVGNGSRRKGAEEDQDGGIDVIYLYCVALGSVVVSVFLIFESSIDSSIYIFSGY